MHQRHNSYQHSLKLHQSKTHKQQKQTFNMLENIKFGISWYELLNISKLLIKYRHALSIGRKFFSEVGVAAKQLSIGAFV